MDDPDQFNNYNGGSIDGNQNYYDGGQLDFSYQNHEHFQQKLQESQQMHQVRILQSDEVHQREAPGYGFRQSSPQGFR